MRRQRHWQKAWEAVKSEAEYIDVFDKEGKTVVLMTVSPIPRYADSAFKHAVKMALEAGGGKIIVRSITRTTLATIEIDLPNN
jgi:hypothetical protein